MGIMTVPVMMRVGGSHVPSGLRAVPSMVSIQAKLAPIIWIIIMISCCL